MGMMKWMLLIFLRHWAVRVVEFTPPDPIWFSLVWEFGYHMHIVEMLTCGCVDTWVRACISDCADACGTHFDILLYCLFFFVF